MKTLMTSLIHRDKIRPAPPGRVFKPSLANPGTGRRFRLLRTAFVLNALFSGFCALALLANGPVVAELCGLPDTSSKQLIASLCVFALLLFALAWRRKPSRVIAWMVIGADVLWVAASALTVRSADLTPIGDALAALVAAVVTTWALLQLLGIRPWGNGRIALAGLGLAVIAWFLEAARAPGDIRPKVLRSGTPTSEARRPPTIGRGCCTPRFRKLEKAQGPGVRWSG